MAKLGLRRFYARFLDHLRSFARRPEDPEEDPGAARPDLRAAYERHYGVRLAADLGRYCDAVAGINLEYLAVGEWWGSAGQNQLPDDDVNALDQVLASPDALALRRFLTRTVQIGNTGNGDVYLAYAAEHAAAQTSVALWDRERNTLGRVVAEGLDSLAFANQLHQLVSDAEDRGEELDFLGDDDDGDDDDVGATGRDDDEPGDATLSIDDVGFEELDIWAPYRVSSGWPFGKLGDVGLGGAEPERDCPVCDLDLRSRWLTEALDGEHDGAAAIRAAVERGDDYRESLDEALEHAGFARDPVYGLYWLLHTYLLGQDDDLERVIAAVDGTPTPIIASAVAAIRRARDADTDGAAGPLAELRARATL